MAHVGKAGPVADRRDLNLNVSNNNDGWYKRYLVTLTILPPGIANGLQGTVWDCGPALFAPPSSQVWQSAPRFAGGFVFDVLMFAHIVGGQTYNKEFHIREAVNGTILICQCSNDPTPFTPGFPLFATWSTLFRDPFFFTADGFANQCQAKRKLWTDPPPH